MSRAHGRRSCLLVLATILLLALDARAGEPHVVIVGESVEKLLGTARRILKDGGAPEVAAKIDQAIGELTMKKGLAGVDQKRPVGAYITFDATKEPELVIFVPTSSPKAFIELLGQLASDVKQGPGEVLSFSGDGVEFFCKSTRGYCFLSKTRESIEAPSLPVTGAGSKRDFGIDVFLGKVPAAAKEVAIQHVESMLRGEWANLPPGLNAASMRGRASGQRMAMESIRRGISEADRISLSVTFGEATRQTQIDFEVVARPNTMLASTLEAYAKSAPSFSALADTSVAYSVVGAVPFPREVRDDLLATVSGPAPKTSTKSDPKALLLASQGQDPALAGGDDVAKVIGGMEKLDFAFVLDSTAEGSLRILAAVKVGSGPALLRLMEGVPASKDGSAPWKEIKGAASPARVFVTDLPFIVADILGTKAHFAVSGDSVFVALGGDTLSTVRSALRRAGQAPSRGGPLSLHIRLSRVLGAFKRVANAKIEKAREIIGTNGDQIDLDVYSSERTLRTRLNFGEAFPRVIAAIAQDAF